MKKLIALILALTMILALTACGGNDDTNPGESTGTPNNTDPSNGETSQPTAPKTETKWLLQTETYVYEDASMGTITSYFTYDELGNPLTAKQEMSDMTVEMIFNYDENGNNISMTTTQGDIAMNYIYTLDENGNRIKTELYQNDELFQSISATYDENGNMLTQKISSSMETLSEYTYDESGNLLLYTISCDGTLMSTTTLEYDDQGRQIGLTTVDSDGNVTNLMEVTYESNTETQVTKDPAGNVLVTLVKTRDENGNVIEVVNSGSAAMPYTYTATYISIEVPVSE